MNLDWYVFEESYLLKIEYNISKCSLSLLIDAKKSVSHPHVTEIKSYEDSFETIEVKFTDILYYKGISSLNILQEPNDDIGSIHELSIGVFESEDGVRIGNSDNFSTISLENRNQIIAEVFTKSSAIQFVEFASEMISFRAGFGQFTLTRTA